jgi:aspartyl-tRNA(Asn)/glutamyl-tRNA(Gln) amidotransferase subunit B
VSPTSPYDTYELVMGLEVHAQLRTNTKLFCGCATTFGAAPNTNICPVCTGQPGALPVLNHEAVAFAIRAGLATHSRIAKQSIFARKNYFYPDLPKGYQISQFDRPLCEEGYLDVTRASATKRISITRIHMEEDAGKSTHDLGNVDVSHVDLNRSSMPLIEIVSGPDIRSPEDGIAYLKSLRAILMYLEVCDGNMQEGSLRCDANVSVRKKGASAFGTRTELKNLNSFKFLEKAVHFEMRRQIDCIEAGDTVVQETRLWDEKRQQTLAMRGKEEAHDYRYFPEPDLPPLEVHEEWIAEIRKALPELPEEKMLRYQQDFGLSRYDAEVLVSEQTMATFFEQAVAHHNAPKRIANWITTELQGRLNADNITLSSTRVTPQHIASLVALIDAGTISGKIAKEVFETCYTSGQDPEAIVEAKGLRQMSDTGEIEGLIDGILTAHPDNVTAYRGGKSNLLGFFVGQVMKATQGRANPKIVNEILRKKLDSA